MREVVDGRHRRRTRDAAICGNLDISLWSWVLEWVMPYQFGRATWQLTDGISAWLTLTGL